MKFMRKVGVISTAVLLLIAFAIPVTAMETQQEMEALQQERDETSASLLSVQDRISTIEARKGKSEDYLRELNTQLDELTEELDDAQEKYSEKQIAFDKINQQLMDAERDKEVQAESMALRIQYIYENSTDAALLSAVFSSDNFTDILNQAENIQQLSQYDRSLLQKYEEACRVVEEKQSVVEQEKAVVQELRDECRQKWSDIQTVYEATMDEVDTLSESLDEEHAEEAALMAKIREQEEQFSGLIEQMIAETAAMNVKVTPVTNAETGQTEYQIQDEDGSQLGTVTEQTADDTAGETAGDVSGGDAASEEGTTETASDDTGSTHGNGLAVEGWTGPVLNAFAGVNDGPTGFETYYNMNMAGVVDIMRGMGNTDEYWVRDDGVKMLGDYVMVAANLDIFERGSIVDCSLGQAIVCDTGGFAAYNPTQLDVAVAW